MGTLVWIVLLSLCHGAWADEPTTKAKIAGIVIGTYQVANRSVVNGAKVEGEGNAQAPPQRLQTGAPEALAPGNP